MEDIKIKEDEYLSVKILNSSFNVPCWINKEATEENKQPQFKGNGVSIWINKQKKKE